MVDILEKIREDKLARELYIEEKGMEKGIEQGLEKVARQMLIEGEPRSKIIKFTGLEEADLEKLEKEAGNVPE